MTKLMITALIGISLLTATDALAGDPVAGKARSVTCAGCHGADGIAMIPGYPNLKGQNEQYLVNSMKAYKNGERTGALANVMKAQANLLNETDIANLAAYYANLK